MDENSEFSELSLAARRAAEREMAQRDHLLDADELMYEDEDETQVGMEQ